MEPVPLLPPKPKKVPIIGTSFRCPKDLLDHLDRIATETGRSRNEVIIEFLRQTAGEYEAEKAQKK
jgi:metal-responsive CopG/Arc/MetJ family transcriptional regulator